MDIPNLIRPDNIGYNPVFLEDIYGKQSDDELIRGWEAEIDTSKDYALRDSLLEAMTRKGLRPSTWLSDRNTKYGLYPDIEDPDFASLLYRKTEFASLASVMPSEETCTQSKSYFETTPVQRLVARFLHPSTPYNGILLNHGVGVGKTCTAITVAETFLEYMPSHSVFIIAPQAIAEGFKRTIFDVGKIKEASKEHYRRTGERWTSSQCTGMTYIRLAGTIDEKNPEIVAKEADKLIRRRYVIMGYVAFSNWVKRKLASAVPSTLVGEAREREENAVLTSIFADHLVIVDEAHNLRDDKGGEISDDVDASLMSDSAAGKALTPILRRIVSVSEGLRLMLMTATPMYNTASEIVFLLNLLLLNDTKDVKRLLKENTFFKTDGSFIEEKQDILATIARRYVSYMRGENPNTFPLRLTPPTSNIESLLSSYPRVSVKRSEGNTSLSELEKNIMKSLPLIISNIDDNSFLGKIMYRKYVANATQPSERDVNEDIGTFVLSQFMQDANIMYPNETSGNTGLQTYMKRSNNTIKGVKVAQYTWKTGKLEDGSDAPTFESVYGSGLINHAPKISAIVESATRSKGISFVYSRFISAGAIPVALAMEARGYCRVLADGTPAPLLKTSVDVRGYKGYYIFLTSDDELSPNFKGVLEYATTFKKAEETDGRKVKMIIGSSIASEGLDLKCIRELHILDSWYHLNRIEQITGRGVRFCSHTLLPPAERNCLVYLHALSIPEYETADLYAYRLAVRKAIPIGKVSRLLKINAWDCMLNADAIMLKGLGSRRIIDAHGRIIEEYELKDKPYTSFCDYNDRCEYICGSKPVSEPGTNNSTYTEFDYRQMFLEKQKILGTIFADSVAEPFDKIRTIVYGDIPWSVGAIGLREALGTIRIKRNDGIYGTLVLMNDYIVFQPLNVTDTQIPAALRYGRAYGRLMRYITPERGSIFSYAPTVTQVENRTKSVSTEKPVNVNESDLFIGAIESINIWKQKVTEILTKTSEVTRPNNLKEEAFQGLRWVFHHFAELTETPYILYKWWMDNVWTPEERAAVCATYVARETLTGDDLMYAKLLEPVEYFQNEEIKGYLQYKDEKVVPHCLIEGEKKPNICPSSFLPSVEKLIGNPVNRKTDTDDIFGMMVIHGGTQIFKTVDKTVGKVLKLEGAECANQSNLRNHWSRLRTIHNKIRAAFPADSPIIRLLLADDEASTLDDIKERAVLQEKEKLLGGQIKHISHLSLKQICPYLDFLLRFSEINRLNGKRWFLSLVEAVRAGAKMKSE
jgi:hypothetical protein